MRHGLTLSLASQSVLGAGAAPTVYDPSGITGITGWFGTNDSSKVVLTGGRVSQWTNNIGGTNNLTASSLRPGVSPAAMNSFDAINFDGASVMFGPALSTLVTASAAIYFLALIPVSSTTDSTTSYSNGGIIDSTSSYQGIFLRSSGKVVAFNWHGGEVKYEDTVTLGSPIIYKYAHTGGNIRTQVNGGTESSTASGDTDSLGGLLKLGQSGSSIYATFKIATLITFNTAIGSTNEAAAMAGLRAQYGL